MADTERGRVIGQGPCPNCGHPAAYKVNKKGHLYVYCSVEGDGGCHSGTQSRSAKGDRELAKRIAKWTSAEDRKRLLGDDVKKTRQDHDGVKTPWWDRELV